MKKIIVTILAIAYLGTSTGTMVNMHYCMGKLANWGLGNDGSRTCRKCGMEKQNKGCCKDESKFVKSQTDQQTTVSVFNFLQIVAVALPVSCFEIPSVDIFTISKENPISHAPPQCSDIAVYIRNCVFLI